jgi:Uma2 family endonuclease
MYWQEVCEHPSLKDLPFKIELDKIGKIIMSPTKVYHSFYQAELSALLREHLKNGTTLVECAIKTSQGTKVADVAWVFKKRLKIIRHEIQCSIAPEICIEVLSTSNSKKEMQIKRALYFEAGAIEVWLCNQQGRLTFYNSNGKLKKSQLAPDFPKNIK